MHGLGWRASAKIEIKENVVNEPDPVTGAPRHHPCWRLGQQAVPLDQEHQQAADADLRQADDLLSVVDFDAGRYSRNSDYHYAQGSRLLL